MEEKEKFSKKKKIEVRFHKGKTKSKITPFIYIYFLIITIFVLLVIISILLYKNYKLNHRPNKGCKENKIQGIRLFLYKNDENANNTKNIIHISYSLDNKLTYPTLFQCYLD